MLSQLKSDSSVWACVAQKYLRHSAGTIFAMGMVALCLMGVLRTSGADSLIATEHQLKAAFIYNFLKFVEWPTDQLNDPNTPLVIGVVVKDPIKAILEDAARNRTIDGRPIIVRTVSTPESARTVHLLFICRTEDDRLAELLPTTDVSVLTVGESDAFAQQGGMINFVVEGDRVRFEINMDSAERAGLKISSQLLKLARTVRRE